MEGVKRPEEGIASLNGMTRSGSKGMISARAPMHRHPRRVIIVVGNLLGHRLAMVAITIAAAIEQYLGLPAPWAWP
jgi:hypothetical protein